jgi:hypothetical protein
MMSLDAEEPFHCAAFSILSRRSIRRGHEPEWLLDTSGIDWGPMFDLPNQRAATYEEAAFRKVAALSGWTLTNVVRVTDRERWLYFERIVDDAPSDQEPFPAASSRELVAGSSARR